MQNMINSVKIPYRLDEAITPCADADSIIPPSPPNKYLRINREIRSPN